MASTTSNLALYKPTVGGDADAWGTQLNANMDILDNAVTLAGAQTLTNKTVNGSSNTITNVSLTTAVTGILPVANGGTGGSSQTANNVLLGNGTGALLKVAPGASGNVLTSNGTTWASTAPATSGGTGTVTSVGLSGGTTGLTTSGGPITTTGTITLAGTLAVANGGTGVTTSTGTGNTVLSTSPTLVSPILGTPTSATLTNATGLPLTTGVTGTLPVANGGTGSSSLAGAGIVTTTGTQSIAGVKSFTNSTNFITAGAGASFGTTTPDPNYALFVKAASSSTTYGGFAAFNNGVNTASTFLTDTTSTPLAIFLSGTFGSTTQVGNISTNGTSTGYNTSSDYRLKHSVVDITDAVARLKLIKPRKFIWNTDQTQTLTDGFIAHELQEVVPNAVNGAKDAVREDGAPIYQGVDASFVIPILTSALQEALARIEALEARA